MVDVELRGLLEESLKEAHCLQCGEGAEFEIAELYENDGQTVKGKVRCVECGIEDQTHFHLVEED